MTDGPGARASFLGTLAATAVLLAFGFALFPASGRDDCHITYWPAYTLSEFGQILNYNGERVEQSSSLLHVLLIAGLARVTPLSVPALGRLVTILFGAAAVVLVHRLARRVDPRGAFLSALLAGSAPYFVYWSFGGLETTLAAFFGISLLLTYARYLDDGRGYVPPWCVWVATPLYLIVRPECMFVVAALLAGALAVVGLKRLRADGEEAAFHTKCVCKLAILAAITAAMSACLLAWRSAYFGSLWPQPVTAKAAGFSLRRVSGGIGYLYVSLFVAGVVPMAILTLVGVVQTGRSWLASGRVRPAEMLVGLYVVAYTGFIAACGGDWMECGRFVAHMLPMVAIVAVGALWRLTDRGGRWLLACVLVVVHLCGSIEIARRRSTSIPLWSTSASRLRCDQTGLSWFETRNRDHLRDTPALHRMRELIAQIRPHKEGEISIMSGQMGMIAYYLAQENFGDIRFIDRYALADRQFTSCPITSHLPRKRLGIDMSYGFFLKNAEAIEETCGIPRPDIILELAEPTTTDYKDILANGYVLVHFLHGYISTRSDFLPGIPLYADQIIAVRRDLAEAIGHTETIRVDFRALQQ